MEIEVRIASLDNADVIMAEDSLASSGLSVVRWPQARVIDPETVLVVTGTTVSLIEGLLELRDRWKDRKPAPLVTVRGPDSEELDLLKANKKDLESMTGSGDHDEADT
jgi:hypothetical protein